MNSFKYLCLTTVVSLSLIGSSVATELDSIGAKYSTVVRSNLQNKNYADLPEFKELSPAEKYVRLAIEMILESLRLQEMNKTKAISAEEALNAGQRMFAELVGNNLGEKYKDPVAENNMQKEKTSFMKSEGMKILTSDSADTSDSDSDSKDTSKTNKIIKKAYDPVSTKYTKYMKEGIFEKPEDALNEYFESVMRSGKDGLFYSIFEYKRGGADFGVNFFDDEKKVHLYKVMKKLLPYKELNVDEQEIVNKNQGQMEYAVDIVRARIEVTVDKATEELNKKILECKNNGNTSGEKNLEDLLTKLKDGCNSVNSQALYEMCERGLSANVKSTKESYSDDFSVIRGKLHEEQFGYFTEYKPESKRVEIIDREWFEKTNSTYNGGCEPENTSLTYDSYRFIPKSPNNGPYPKNIVEDSEKDKDIQIDTLDTGYEVRGINLKQAIGFVTRYNSKKEQYQVIENDEHYTIAKLHYERGHNKENPDWFIPVTASILKFGDDGRAYWEVREKTDKTKM